MLRRWHIGEPCPLCGELLGELPRNRGATCLADPIEHFQSWDYVPSPSKITVNAVYVRLDEYRLVYRSNQAMAELQVNGLSSQIEPIPILPLNEMLEKLRILLSFQ